MIRTLCSFLCLCIVVCHTHNKGPPDSNSRPEETAEDWVLRSYQYRRMKPDISDGDCKSIQPTKLDLVDQCTALLPYFDKDHSNLELLQDLASIIGDLTDSDDALDMEVAVYSCVLIPLVFLRSKADTWCLLEKFNNALSNFQDSEEKEKQSALEILQKLRPVVERIRYFIGHLSEYPFSKMPIIPSDEDYATIGDLNSNYMKDLMTSFG